MSTSGIFAGQQPKGDTMYPIAPAARGSPEISAFTMANYGTIGARRGIANTAVLGTEPANI